MLRRYVRLVFKIEDKAVSKLSTEFTDIEAETPAVTNIIGAGFSGITVAVHQIDTYLKAYDETPNIRPLTIRLIDKTGTFGPGLPYQDTDNILLLNQPAYAMSPLPDDPDHFVRWRADQGHSHNPNDFATRSEYGTYLKALFTEAVQRARESDAPINIETITVDVEAIHFGTISNTLVTSNGEQLESSATVLADGHQRRAILDGFQNDKAVFDAPFSDPAITEHIKTIKSKPLQQNIAVVGTSQSMLDALAILDHEGFQGTIYAFSRDQVLPWAFHPERYGEQSNIPTYEPRYFTFEALSQRHTLTGDDLIEHLKHEINHACAHGYDTGHVVTAPALFEELRALEKDSVLTDACQKVRKYIAKLYGNPTPPARYDLLQNYLATGRLQLVKADIRDEKITRTADGFAIQTEPDTQNLTVSAIFNAASFTRDPLASPLLKQAEEQNALRWKDRTTKKLEGGKQENASLFVVGPATNTTKWGVETFRDHCKQAAEESLRQALSVPTQQDEFLLTTNLTSTSNPQPKI